MGGGRRVRVGVLVGFVVGSLLALSPRSAVGGGEFVALDAPVRLLDTRPGAATADGLFAGTGVRPADSTLELAVAGRAGLPTDVANVVLNVTAVDPHGWGFVTVHPGGTERPNASNVNYDTGQTIANTVVSPVGPDGTILLYTFASTQLLVDAVGHLPADAFDALPASARLLDTRPGAATIDGSFAGIGRLPADSTLELEVAGRAGIPASATTVVLNVTVTAPGSWGFITVHPTGTARPNASNVNYDVGTTVANTVVTGLGSGGRISIYTYGATDVIVDIAGHLDPSSFTPLTAPARVLDTRVGSTTDDGEQAGIGLRGASSTVQVELAGRVGLPVDASSVVLNVTAVDALGWGFVTEYPTGATRPNASNLNYDGAAAVANTVFARLGAGGDVCIYTYGATHLLVDVVGYLPGPPPPPAGPTCPPIVYGPSRSLGSGTVADVNNHGLVVGTEYGGSAADSDALWWPTLDDGPRLVPGIPADVRNSFAIAVNDVDQVLVQTHSDVAGPRLLVIDLPSGASTTFPGLDGAAGIDVSEVSEVTGVDLNDRGEVLVNALHDEHGAHHAIAVWDSTTGEVETHPELVRNTHAADLNDLGHVVGEIVGSTSGDAFVWDRTTGIVHRLGRGGYPVAGATGVNDRGNVVGVLSDGLKASVPSFWVDRTSAPTTVPGRFPALLELNESGLALGSTMPPGLTWRAPGVWDSASDRWLSIPSAFGDSIHAINDVGQIVGLAGGVPAVWVPV